MKNYLNKLYEKDNLTNIDLENLHNKFLEEVDILKNINWLEGASIDLTLISKVSYYETLFNLSKMQLSTLKTMLIPELIKDFDSIKHMQNNSNKNLDNLNKLKKDSNFFIKDNEIIFSTKSDKYWLFVTYLKWNILRTYNFASNKNWYHIFWDWRFCSWNTYSTLQNLLLEKQDIFLFIVFLKKILTDYDDKKHHLAKSLDFELWKDYLKDWKESDKNKLLNIWKTKKEQFLWYWKKDLSKEWYIYLINSINRLKEKNL